MYNLREKSPTEVTTIENMGFFKEIPNYRGNLYISPERLKVTIGGLYAHVGIYESTLMEAMQSMYGLS